MELAPPKEGVYSSDSDEGADDEKHNGVDPDPEFQMFGGYISDSDSVSNSDPGPEPLSGPGPELEVEIEHDPDPAEYSLFSMYNTRTFKVV